MIIRRAGGETYVTDPVRPEGQVFFRRSRWCRVAATDRQSRSVKMTSVACAVPRRRSDHHLVAGDEQRRGRPLPSPGQRGSPKATPTPPCRRETSLPGGTAPSAGSPCRGTSPGSGRGPPWRSPRTPLRAHISRRPFEISHELPPTATPRGDRAVRDSGSDGSQWRYRQSWDDGLAPALLAPINLSPTIIDHTVRSLRVRPVELVVGGPASPA
jgi:hypothetical protein